MSSPDIDEQDESQYTPLLSSEYSRKRYELPLNTSCPVTIEPVLILYFIAVMGSLMMDTQYYYSYYAQLAGISGNQHEVSNCLN